MNDSEKIKLLKKLMLGRIDWMQSYRETFSVKPGIGLPSGLTGSEAEISIARRILEDKPVTIVERRRPSAWESDMMPGYPVED